MYPLPWYFMPVRTALVEEMIEAGGEDEVAADAGDNKSKFEEVEAVPDAATASVAHMAPFVYDL